jgi:sugar lactone lactonase YvrE
MTTAKWDVLVEGLGRLEAPCLDLDGQLCFSDIADDGAIYRLRADGHLEVVVRGRHHVGGLVAHADGGFVATGSTVAVIDDRGERVVMTPEGGWGFNDLATDALGNVFVGMHGERPSAIAPKIDASMWRIGCDNSITHCYGGIQLTNGVGIHPTAGACITTTLCEKWSGSATSLQMAYSRSAVCCTSCATECPTGWPSTKPGASGSPRSRRARSCE